VSSRIVAFALIGALAIAVAGAARADAGSRQLALGASELSWNSLSNLDAFSTSVHRTPATWTIWSDWGGPTAAFPSATFMAGLKSRHVIPLVFWQPVDPKNLGSGAFAYTRIAHGDFDGYLKSWSAAAKAYGGTIIVRFAPEMDGWWFPWSVTKHGNSPKRFVKAWRHIWTVIHHVGATNVRMLWSPAQPCRCQSDLYPGDGYVDYVGFTAYNWANADHPWREMGAIIKKKMALVTRLTSKPVIVPELGSNDVGGDKAQWIADGYTKVYKRFPEIKAIVYFDVNMQFDDQPDWRLQTPAAALSAYAKLLAHPHFQGAL
jgi:hypothetical protein